ncbi:uncharacterized protein LOC128707933 [Anopheles marshallii]|uniref:uncharacterized protein LOC128707933 n=1 Tax=Anopheles marshallii TaxID=1521116 RepID=UPI00237A4C2E|nr:uncharacterized protein LOC128707933 [Anopheles marshallii]
MASMAVFATLLVHLLVHCSTQANPVPAKILGKYVLSYQSPGSNIHLDAHEDPEEINELSNGIESGESNTEFVNPQTASNHYRYRPQYQESADQYEDQEQEHDSADYADDSATASANHQHHYMTTYKTVTKHGGKTRNRPNYSDADSEEEEDEVDTNASEESNAYNAFRGYHNKGKKHQTHHATSSSTGTSSGHDGQFSYHHYSQHHHRPKHQEQQQQQSHHYHHQVSSAHTSYHPQLIQAYKILHGTPNRLPTSHEYSDDDGSEEEDEDADFHSGSAIGAAAGTLPGYGGPGPQIIHTKGRAIPISQHVEIETPVPVPYVKKIHVPIPQEVRVKIPHPVLVPVPRPYPVHIPVAQPIAVPDIKEITVPIEKIVPYPVEKKIPVPIEKPVPYPIEKHVPVYLPQPIPVKVPIVKTIIHRVKQQTASGPTLPPGSGSLW